MSQENVEVVKEIFRFAQTDWERVSARLDPDVRLDQSRFPDGGISHGRDALRDFYRGWFGTWDELQITPDRFCDRGDKVVVLLTITGRGKGSGTPVTLRAADVWTLRDGRVVELVGYPDRAEVLDSLGTPLGALAERAFGALNARDLDGFMAVTTADVEFTSMVAEMEGTTFRGHDGIRDWWKTVIEAFGDVHWEVLDVRGPGNEGVAEVVMDGTLGGVPVDLRMWLAARVRDGKVTWWSWYRTEAEALEAAGLSDLR